MLSAVENHYGGGPGRPYQHHFGGQQGASLQMPTTSAAMSAAEFARPHPKPRYSGGSLRNGLTSPRSKYSEQSGPVNLAVSQSAAAITLSLAEESVPSSRRLSPGAIGATAEIGCLSEHSSGQPQPSQQSQSSSINMLYSPKLSFCPTSGGPTNGYQAINYSSLYGRANTIYGNPTLYNSHLVGRSLQRPPYQLEPYSTYLPPVTYSPPGAVPPQMLPIGMSQPTAISSVQKSPGDNGNANSDVVHPLPPSPSISAAAKLVNDRSHTPQTPLQQQSLHHTQQPQLQQPLVLSSNNNSSGSSKTKEKLEGKVQSGHHQSHHHHNITNNSNISHNQNPITSNGKTVGFKVPSGKEGSLKHRILTRPYGEKDSKNRSSAIHGSVVRSSSNNNAPTNFTKGSLIELFNGELRRVEDMRTEDFISSSSKNPDLQLAETTVVKITPRPSNVMITFSYNNLKYDMESVTEHPYFVYGQGWASCDPDGSVRVFGLKCQRLQVGDVCISLTPRDSVLAQHGRSVSTSVSSGHHQSSTLPPQHILQQHQHHQHPPTLHQPLHPHQPPHHHPPSPQQAYYNNCVYNYCKDQVDQAQNLSRKPLPPQTVPTTATVTAVTSRPAPHFIDAMPDAIAIHPLHNMPTNVSSYSAYLNGGLNGRSAVDERRPHSNQSSTSSSSSMFRTTGGTLDDNAKHINDVIATNMTINLSNHVALHSTGGRPLSNHAAPTMYGASDIDDVSLSSSRKRRWSAPDNICEDEACQQSGQKCKH